MSSESSSTRRGILFCLVGAAGSGKSSLGERLISEDSSGMVRSRSCTTRAPRGAERDGVEYDFLSEEEFERRRLAHYFFEWEQIHTARYGTPREPFERAIAGKGDLLLIIDIKGALAVKKSFPDDTVIVFVTPKNFAELETRIRNRSAVSEQELQKRLLTARAEYAALNSNAALIDYLVINEKLEIAYTDLRSIVYAERCKLQRIIQVPIVGTLPA